MGLLRALGKGAAAAAGGQADLYRQQNEDALELVRRRRLAEMEDEFESSRYERDRERENADLLDENSPYNIKRQHALDDFGEKEKLKAKSTSTKNMQFQDVATGEFDELGEPIKKTYAVINGKLVPAESLMDKGMLSKSQDAAAPEGDEGADWKSKFFSSKESPETPKEKPDVKQPDIPQQQESSTEGSVPDAVLSNPGTFVAQEKAGVFSDRSPQEMLALIQRALGNVGPIDTIRGHRGDLLRLEKKYEEMIK